MIITRKFNQMYRKIKLLIYKNMFKRFSGKDQQLSSPEFFYLECIHLMDKPTISQFADFLDISSPNATYRIKSLISKGYLTKEKSAEDGREYHLVPTKKFLDLYEKDQSSFKELKKDLSKDESKKMDRILKILTEKFNWRYI